MYYADFFLYIHEAEHIGQQRVTNPAAALPVASWYGVRVHLVITVMHLKPSHIQLLLITLSLQQTSASSILGFGRVGGRSHHLVILRIGQELIDRGHTFTLLISEQDHEKLFPSLLDGAETKAVNIVTFAGPGPSPLSSQDLMPENLIMVMGQLITLHYCRTVLVMVLPLLVSHCTCVSACLRLQTDDTYLQCTLSVQTVCLLLAAPMGAYGRQPCSSCM